MEQQQIRRDPPGRRDLDALPKAHLHLHFTGSMSVATLRELADAAHLELPERLLDAEALSVPANARGWYRFQRSYDIARRAVQGERALRTVVRQAARDDAAEGSRRLELQVDPTSYAASVGGLTPALEIVLDAALAATAETGVQVAVIVATSRLRNALDARTLARLAAKHAGEGAGQVVGFGLSNNERRGDTREWAPAFALARRAGIPGVPHAGELRGPEHVADVVRWLHPARLGHGVRAAESPELLRSIVDAGIAFEVCPASNLSLGVYPEPDDVPLPALLAAGARVALSADDPLLFLSRLTDQYRLVRDAFDLSDAQLAALARQSIDASFAPAMSKQVWRQQIDAWLATPGIA